jgi:hypothetical protein
MIKVIPYNKTLLKNFKFNINEFKELKRIGSLKNLENFLDELGGKVDSNVFVFKDKVLCIVGCLPLNRNTADLFLIPNIFIKKYKYSLCKEIIKYLENYIQSHSFGRYQTMCLEEKQYTSWMTFLGFKKEVVLKQYGDNKENYILWVRYK